MTSTSGRREVMLRFTVDNVSACIYNNIECMMAWRLMMLPVMSSVGYAMWLLSAGTSMTLDLVDGSDWSSRVETVMGAVIVAKAAREDRAKATPAFLTSAGNGDQTES